jgi:hypothetical protein
VLEANRENRRICDQEISTPTNSTDHLEDRRIKNDTENRFHRVEWDGRGSVT